MPRFFTDDLAPITYYDTKSSKPPIVFIHGWTSSAADWRGAVLALRRNYRCISIDLRGHGRTPARTPLTIERLAQDVHQLINYLGLINPTIVGWSMGGLTTFEYLKQFGYQHLSGVVFVDQTPRMQTNDEWAMGLFGNYTTEHVELLQVLFEADHQRVLRRFSVGIFHPKHRFLRFFMWATANLRGKYDSQTLLALAENMADCDYRELLPTLNLPILLCYGRESWLYPGDVGEYILDQLPQAELINFEHSGHCPPIEEPRKFVRSIHAFMQQKVLSQSTLAHVQQGVSML